MKILYVIDTLEIGGAEKSLLEIIAHFTHTKAVMCHIYPGETLKATYQKLNIPVISLNVPGRYSFAQAAGQISAVIRREQPDLLHTTLFRADVIGRYVGRQLGIPVISSFVNEPYSPLRKLGLSIKGKLKLRCIQGVDAQTAHWCKHFTANSETIKQANVHVLAIPSQKVSVIYRGRKPDPFLHADAQHVEQIRMGLGLQANNQIILNVGRMLQRKGQAELIQAMPALLQQQPNVRLLIAGEGDYRSSLEGFIAELGVGHAVQLLGQRNDIPTLLHLADVFAFPSHYEGYPGALVEAMLAGCPIVASDIPVHREAIKSGKTGLLFKLQDIEDLSKTILELLAHPETAKCLGSNARQDALARFHIDQIAAQHEQLYQRVLEA